ncbi:putative alpha-helical protein [Cryptosporidium canis]|uniref:Alpha-helical protein n=1 Tax=Cryptosporidium canis TaxID=195482 RepID=A0ABQ8P1M7_9CRYT|nr:putative alpha-helical protein [Cryptosporidium canis]KAJ1604954.1 putative alpha-helical protein [Cryptosporidium canis]
MNKEVKKMDPSYNNVKRKPIKLHNRKGLNSKLVVSRPEKTVYTPAGAFNDHGHAKNCSELLGGPSTHKGKEVISSTLTTEEHKTNEYTQAEIALKEAQKNRIHKQIEARASLTHRQRVSKFNEKLSMLPEHFDIPKVGPG